MTVEDPIEYYIDGIGQTQVNTKVEMTFARGLRAILRQDPDVVMVGEIRDLETAQIAVQASLTGHLVLSTLHTNTAVGAVTRLRDMGIEPFLLSSSLIGVLAQRLVRVLDPATTRAYRPANTSVALLGSIRRTRRCSTARMKRPCGPAALATAAVPASTNS
jgi:general secretion pathway protein E